MEHEKSNLHPLIGDALHNRAKRARGWLMDAAFPMWWEAGFDRSTACFHERLAIDGTPVILPRRVRVQARQTFCYALAGDMGWDGPWRDAANAGADVLLERCIRADGGTRHMLGADGKPLDDRRDLYDLAFVIFALAHAGRTLKRADCISGARALIAWLDGAWRHPIGGYLEGDVVACPPRRQNPHMHLFEAIMALHEATGDPAHFDRASRLATLGAQTLYQPDRGALVEYFDDGFSPAPGDAGRIVEPGHQFEWSWLLERHRLSGGGDHSHTSEVLMLNAEVRGVSASGVVWDEIDTDGGVRASTSRLWPHTERLKANLCQFIRSGDEQAAARAVSAFDNLWAYLDTPVVGLWRDRRLADGSFLEEPATASSFYHIVLALSELMRAARDEA